MELQNDDDDQISVKLQTARSDLNAIITQSLDIQQSYQKLDDKFETMHQTLTLTSKRIAPLQSLSIANKALGARINRAISPAAALLDGFRLAESLQRRLVEIASKLASEENPRKRLKKLIKYVSCVDRLNEAIGSIGRESEPAIQKLQEVVEFLSRTKAADYYRTQRLREALITLKALCETEVDSMRFDGVLDEALLNLQDEYEALLQRLRHRKVATAAAASAGGEAEGEVENLSEGLGNDLEIEVLRRISETLAANDCLDICIDIFVKVRYRRAAKALMKLNPDYLKTYTPEEIDDMEWESLETSISLWIQHFHLAVKAVLVSEKHLCNQVMEAIIWPECFIKIADKIMAVFFRFGEGVARSKKEPQKLFKLLDMFESLENLKLEFVQVFEGEAGADICTRFRELQKLIVHASTRVFWEFGLQIEGNQDGSPPPQDGSVPKLVRYAINYLKNLCAGSYSSLMAQVLRTEQLWKGGGLPNVENNQDLLKDAVVNMMEAIQRNTEFKKSLYKDRVVAQIFSMNTFWYIYMRTRGTELGKLLGDAYMKKRYRTVAEESAYLYQKQAWGSLVRVLEKEETKRETSKEAVRAKIEAFIAGLEEMCERHRSSYKIVSDADLREQMKEATIRLVVPAYREFYDAVSTPVKASYPSPDSVEATLRQIFEDGDAKQNVVRVERRMLVDRPRFRRSEIDGDDL